MKEIELPGKTLKLSKRGLSKSSPWPANVVFIAWILFIVFGVFKFYIEPESFSWTGVISLIFILPLTFILFRLRDPSFNNKMYHHYLNVHGDTLTIKQPQKNPQKFNLNDLESWTITGDQITLHIDGSEHEIKMGYGIPYQDVQELKSWLEDVKGAGRAMGD